MSSRKRRQFKPEEIMAILRKHLVDKVPVSEVCDQHGLNPTVFYRWQKQLFEKGASAFERQAPARNQRLVLEKKVTSLESKLANKDSVIAEIMASHIELKKSLGEV